MEGRSSDLFASRWPCFWMVFSEQGHSMYYNDVIVVIGVLIVEKCAYNVLV